MEIIHKRRLYILLFFCLIFISQAVLAQNTIDFPAMRDPATNLVTRREKSDIYSKLDCCPCASPFYKCNCQKSKEMKAYIEALLEVGIAKEEIFYRVAKRFSINTILDAQIKAEVEKRLVKEAGEKHPQIILEPTSFDFGQVSKKQGKIKTIFQIFNRGTEDLIINNIKPRCPCTTASLKVGENKSSYFSTKGASSDWQAVISPNQGGELEVVLDLNHSSLGSGEVIREILVTSNDPVYPQTTIRIEAEVGG